MYRLHGVALRPGLNDLSDEQLRAMERPVGGKNLFAWFVNQGLLCSVPGEPVRAAVVKSPQVVVAEALPSQEPSLLEQPVPAPEPQKRGRPSRWR